MSPANVVMLALRSLLAMVLAFVVVALVNQGGGELAELAEFPGGGEPRLAWDLGWVFIAGVLAAWVVAKLAPRAPRMHAVVFFVLTLAVAVYAVVQLGDGWPRWFSIGILLGLPLQAWLGTRWALRARRDGRGESVAARIHREDS